MKAANMKNVLAAVLLGIVGAWVLVEWAEEPYLSSCSLSSQDSSGRLEHGCV